MILHRRRYIELMLILFDKLTNSELFRSFVRKTHDNLSNNSQNGIYLRDDTVKFYSIVLGAHFLHQKLNDGSAEGVQEVIYPLYMFYINSLAFSDVASRLGVLLHVYIAPL